MGTERIISDVTSAADARKVEETVKTGYAEPLIETLLNWIGVEQDLANSYEGLSRDPRRASSRSFYQGLAQEARETAMTLDEVRRKLEGLDAAQVKRIERLEGAD